MTDWTVERHVNGADPAVVELYHAFIEVVSGFGPFTYAVAKTSITLKGTRRGFAGATPKRDVLGGYLDLRRRIPETGVDPRIRNASPYTKRLFVHHFRIASLSDLDDRFAGWVRGLRGGQRRPPEPLTGQSANSTERNSP